ncbi:MAG: hypothetical protein IPJ00_20485 [Saprospirales bacterium]|nr:hypothetical protein [Saprospirales bacterium]
MTIIRTLTIGEKVWLGDTQYEVMAQARDEKNKVMAETFDIKPVDWADSIKNAPELLRSQAQKTKLIRVKLPIKVL